MRNKGLAVIVMLMMLALFSGCDLLNEENVDDTSNTQEQATTEIDETDEPNEEETLNTEDETQTPIIEENQSREGTLVGEVKQERPFDDLLIAQGYVLKSLPNGFPVSIPYSWILVEDITDGQYDTAFCYNLPLDERQIADRFADLNNFTMDHEGPSARMTHIARFTSNSEYETLSGVLEFYDDNCVNLSLEFEGEPEFYGEDPSTMLSDEERAERGLDTEENVIVENYDADRVRSLPNGYEDELDAFRVYSIITDMDFDAPDIQSIEDKIRNEEIEIFDLVNGFPKIFPYEWYLLAENDDPVNNAWSGTFSTDTTMREAIWKHHDMLSDHNADIIDYSIQESPNMNRKGHVTFEFNDEHGTGSDMIPPK